MNKIVAVLAALCAGLAVFFGWKFVSDKIEKPEKTPAETVEESAEQAAGPAVDLEALYASHEPDEVVLTFGDREVTWAEFYYQLAGNVTYIEDMFGYYGMPVDWNSALNEESGLTVSEELSKIAAESIRQLLVASDYAAAQGVDLTDEQNAELADYIAANIETTCGEGATEEDFNKYLESVHVPRSIFDTMMRWNYLDQNLFTKLFGENGSAISDEEAMDYIRQHGYMQVNHILFLNNGSDGNKLDEAALKEKKAQAEALTAELRAAGSTEELLALFAQRKQELDEDTGKTLYPDGYVFTPDDNYVEEFKTAGAALGEYEVSDPVESVYGYHVMLRLPLTPDSLLDAQTGRTMRTACAEEKYNALITERIEAAPIAYAPGFEKPDIGAFVK